MRCSSFRSLLASTFLVGVLGVTAATAVAQSSPPQDDSKLITGLPKKTKAWTGDLDKLLKSRTIRLAVTYSRSTYYVVKGVPQGGVYELGKAFEDYLNLKYPQAKKNIRIHVIMIPGPRDKLFASVNAGFADIAAAGLTVTPERQKRKPAHRCDRHRDRLRRPFVLCRDHRQAWSWRAQPAVVCAAT